MNLVIDIGNTRVKSYIFQNSEIIHRQIDENLTASHLTRLMTKFTISKAILSTTREHDNKFELNMRSRIPNTLIFDPAKTPIPINNQYLTPETLGADRLAAAVGAVTLFPKQNILIFDFGTALTIDWVAADNTYHGGNISLGLSARFAALHAMTARLPLVTATQNAPEFGNNTQTAIQAGVMHSMEYEIEAYINRNRDKTIIFTGGEVDFFEKLVKNTIFADCELVPKGLNRILEYNA